MLNYVKLKDGWIIFRCFTSLGLLQNHVGSPAQAGQAIRALKINIKPMKTIMSIILIMVLNPLIFAGDNTYEKAMKEAMEKLSQVASIDDFQQAANQFDRIASVENDNWLPYYHAAYAKVMMAAMEQDVQKKDPYLDAAQLDLDAIEKLEHDASERMALEGFLMMIRMSVDPSRGMELGMDCGMIVNQAYTMNKENPRAVLVLAQFKHGSASYMGEDTSEACAMFDEVLELLDQPQKKRSEKFLPYWGKEMALMMQQQCQIE